MTGRAVIGPAAAIIVCLLLGGCAPDGADEGADRASAGRPKVLWFAVDSFDWRILRPLIDAGRMPNLQRLIERGAWGDLQSIAPLLSPVIWTSVATGVRPDKHGIIDFVATDPRTGAVLPVTSTLRRVPAYWNVLSDAGVSVGVVAWWASFPAESVEGFMVTDRIAYQLFRGRIEDRAEDNPLKTYPPDLYGRIAPLIVEPPSIGRAELSRFIDLDRHEAAFSPDDRERVDDLRTVLAATRTYAAIGEKLFEEIPTDLRVIYFEGPDTASHLFMPFAPPARPGIPEEKVEWFGRVVPEFYVYQDELIGRFLEAFADEETMVIVSSDHGFATGSDRPEGDSRIGGGQAAAWHTREGVILLSGRDVRPGVRILGASILDLVPTLLALFDLPVAQDMDGKVLTAALTEEHLEKHPIRTIATYDTGRDPAGRSAHVTRDDQELLARLQSLGYIQQDKPTASINQGTIHLQNGDYDRAIDSFRSAIAQDDKDPVRLNLARAYRFRGDLEDAEDQLRILLERGWNRPAVLTEMAAVSRVRKDWDAAERLLGEALEADPEFSEAHRHLARLYEEQGRWDDAVAAYRRAIDADPGSAEARNQLGVALKRLGRVEEAIASLEDAIETDPDLPGPYNNLGLIYRDLGKPDRAREVLDTGIQMAPRSAILLNSLGSLIHDEGDARGSIALFERALESDPGYAEAVSNLAVIHRELGDTAAEAGALRRLIELEPANLDARLSLALSLLAADRAADAIGVLEEVLAIDPDHVKGLIMLGEVHLGRGRHEEAAAFLERAARIEGSIPRVWNQLGRCYLALGRPGEAAGALRRSLDLEPDQPAVARKLEEIGGGSRQK